jgi:hypothetical protein
MNFLNNFYYLNVKIKLLSSFVSFLRRANFSKINYLSIGCATVSNLTVNKRPFFKSLISQTIPNYILIVTHHFIAKAI